MAHIFNIFNLKTDIKVSISSTNGDLAIVTDNNTNPAAYIKGTGTADLLKVVDGSTTVFTIEDGGDVVLGNNCNLVVVMAMVIDFSATSDGPSMASELLDDYEEELLHLQLVLKTKVMPVQIKTMVDM